MKYINADIILPEELLKEVQNMYKADGVHPETRRFAQEMGRKLGQPGVFEKETWKSGSCLLQAPRLTSFLLSIVCPAIPSKNRVYQNK